MFDRRESLFANIRPHLCLFFLCGSLKHPLAILASVEYRLAPENPFPAAPIDGLSAAAYFLESNPLRKIDIAGISAGGYLATVTALETFRRYPDRVKRYD